jgi:hypothetical protein
MKITKDWTLTKRDPDSAALPEHVMEVDHAWVDDKGRAIGGRATITDRRGINPPEDQRFELEIVSLRRGSTYGSAGSSFIADLDKAKREAVKRLARQGKGLARSYPRGAR